MEEYVSNSHKSKESDIPKKRVEKIVTGEVKTRKKSGFQKFINSVVSEDASDVKSYILMDVLIPAVKKAISDIVTSGIEIILYGNTTSKRSTASKISYRSYYEDRNPIRDRRSFDRVSPYDYDEITLESRQEAEEILCRMDELIGVYGNASIGDFKDFVGITSNYTDYNYGWTDLRNASIVNVRGGGYTVKMPRVMPLTR